MVTSPASNSARWYAFAEASWSSWVRQEKPSARTTASGPAARTAGSSECSAIRTETSWCPRSTPQLPASPQQLPTRVTVAPARRSSRSSVLGWSADARLLSDAGARVTRLGGCCGLAGNWGVERGHHDVSVAVAETQLLPAVRDLGDDAVVLAGGFSCRTQLDQLAGRHGQHLAELLAARLP